MKFTLPDDVIAQPVPPDIEESWAQAAPRLGPFAAGLRYFAVVPSTNDLAMRLADAGAKEGTTVLAEAQTAGRGRRGREWFSPPGSGIYVSVVLRPESDSSLVSAWRTSRMTLTAGVAVAQAVRAATGLAVELKWPNDSVFERRKLAGILAEMGTSGKAGSAAVVLGIGVNVRATSFPQTLRSTATSLETELGRPVDRALVLVEVLSALAARYDDLRSGQFDAILTEWRRLARPLPGAPIEWEGPSGALHGRAVDLDEHGALLAQTDQGETVRIVAGEVRWK